MTIQQAHQQLRQQLIPLYPEGEAEVMTDMVMEALTGWSRMERMGQKEAVLLPERVQQLEKWTQELLHNRPVQYVLGSCWFYKHWFKVNEQVLIPRSETEELVHWIVSNSRSSNDELTIVDIGTGSGCIAISLKEALTHATVHAIDKSNEALEIARQNANDIGVDINFIALDFLDPSSVATLPVSDILVSNPPYIPTSEKKEMAAHVVNYEPALALFVDNKDPLIFYKRIAEVGKTHLKKKGWVYVEIHESFGTAVKDLFLQQGYSNVELKKDMQGKDRMVRAQYL